MNDIDPDDIQTIIDIIRKCIEDSNKERVRERLLKPGLFERAVLWLGLRKKSKLRGAALAQFVSACLSMARADAELGEDATLAEELLKATGA